MIINRVCLYCHKGFQRSLGPKAIKKGKGKYCNEQCCIRHFYILRSLGKIKLNLDGLKFGRGIKGSKNSKWKGGITPFNKLERDRFRNTMQKLVFERDQYTCQLCFQKGGDLQVDHIQSWADYIELRFSLNNCRTLCVSCHYFITFGKLMPDNIKTWGHNLKYEMGVA